MTWELWSKRVGNKGYISQALEAELYKQGLRWLTRLQAHRKHKLISLTAKGRFGPRVIVESVHACSRTSRQGSIRVTPAR